MRRIAISGLVALAAALGGLAVPATAMAQPTAARPSLQDRPAPLARVPLTARPTAAAEEDAGEPLISCVLRTDCLGVEGLFSPGDGGESPLTRVARWTGSSWQGVSVALSKGTKSVDPVGVSCRGAKSCLVVGDCVTSASDSAPSHVLALSYNGRSLKPTPAVALPKGTTDAALTSVSCATTSYCLAVGLANGDTAAFGESGSLNIIETWNGAKWTLHTTPTGTTTSLQLSDAACATPAFCVLTGVSFASTSTSFTDKLYLASWNGKRLTTMQSPSVSSGPVFIFPTGASCASASNCAVTGVDGVASEGLSESSAAFTEIWNGKAWQLGTVTWPKGTADPSTSAVSCYAAHTCEVVGGYSANASQTSPGNAAAISFNGPAGKLQAVPAPPKGHSNGFTTVSCLPWGGCVAIGYTAKTTATWPALMTGVWNGKTWKLDPGL